MSADPVRDKLWPISRTWLRRGGDQSPISDKEMLAAQAAVFLGVAGLGKTKEMERFRVLEEAAGKRLVFKHVADMSHTSDSLRAELRALALGPETTVYLDALDEAMVPLRMAASFVADWIRSTELAHMPRLRLSCRSTLWPAEVGAALEAKWPESEVVNAVLTPLDEVQISAAAVAEGVIPSKFLAAVREAGAMPLAESPLTLRMLLESFDPKRQLPTRRADLFRAAVARLASERQERRLKGTDGPATAEQVLSLARKLAFVCLLSGHECFNTLTESLGEGLSLASLSSDGEAVGLTIAAVEGARSRPLFEGRGALQFCFAHRQLAEYLAAQCIAKLRPEQAVAILSSRVLSGFAVGGAVREVAVFAVMESPDLAAWMASNDPEVIGRSDVGDRAVRQLATSRLLKMFETGQYTSSQLRLGEVDLAGFAYAEPEADLRGAISHWVRTDPGDRNDVLDCIVALIRSWRLASMSEDLATLALSAKVDGSVRRAAAWSLAEIGTLESRVRLRPLLQNTDAYLSLKGAALTCLWPDHMSSAELLAHLCEPVDPQFSGGYESFLRHLNESGFCADDDLLAGLRWADQHTRLETDYRLQRLVHRIVTCAAKHIDKLGVAKELAKLIYGAAARHVHLIVRMSDGLGVPKLDRYAHHYLAEAESGRRKLLLELAALSTKEDDLVLVGTRNSELCRVEDFTWLLEASLDDERPINVRRQLARLAALLPWQDRPECLEGWRARRTMPPISEALEDPQETARKRQEYRLQWEQDKPPKRLLKPPPAERVRASLDRCRKEGAFFEQLALDLTLEPDSTHYSPSRFLIDTPGWNAAAVETRRSVVEAAKAFLFAASEMADMCRSEPLQTILCPHMAAFLLLATEDPDWLLAQDQSWWGKWTWFLMRELRYRLGHEALEPKRRLWEMLIAKAGAEVRDELLRLAVRSAQTPEQEESAANLCISLLELADMSADPSLDAGLLSAVKGGMISKRVLRATLQFLIVRSSSARQFCRTILLGSPKDDSFRVDAVSVLLCETPDEAWDDVMAALAKDSALALAVILSWVRWDRLRHWAPSRWSAAALGPGKIAKLLTVMLEIMPPDEDETRESRDNFEVGEAVKQRWVWLNWIGEQATREAVDAADSLVARFGGRYPWLSRYAARAWSGYRRAVWKPLPEASLVKLLADQERRLITTSFDAAQAVAYIVRQYERDLLHSSPSPIEEIWNTSDRPSPKKEEVVSERICIRIRQYFTQYAVAASNEVQIRRRVGSAPRGGAAGSKPDVFVQVLPLATGSGETIAVPVEVKLAHNKQARTALQNQLVVRYMEELDAEWGVYVVVWMAEAEGRYRARWQSVRAAREWLEAEVEKLEAGRNVIAVVVDATLPKKTASRFLHSGKFSGKTAKASAKKLKGRKAKGGTTGKGTARAASGKVARGLGGGRNAKGAKKSR